MSKSLNLYAGTAIGLTVLLVGAFNFADRNIAQMPENLPTLGPLSANALAELEAEKVALQQAAQAEVPQGGLVAAAQADEGIDGTKFGIGRPALPEEVAAWDVDVQPDGTGLPVGSGNAYDGEAVFEENCAICHGSFAEGVDNWPKLAGGEGSLADEDPLKTVGSYWPHVSTAWDYVNRSMPFGAAQTLTADEVYAIVAYILYSNDLIDDDFELSNETLASVELPNAQGFIIDDREETEYPNWRTEPCMENCKDSVEITMRATVLDVTPEEEGDAEAAAPAAETAEQVEVAAAEEAAPAAEEASVETASATVNMELAAAGENVFKKCKACHQVGDGAKNRTGPHLNGIMGRDIGGLDGFKYSKTMSNMGGVWDEATLSAFLADPRGTVKGTKMAFAGLKKEDDVAAVTEYLKTFEQ